jgi:predicted glycosyltransferase
MIGYYIHHVGHGHLHRALSIANHLHEPVTAFSSLPQSRHWPGQWVELPRDDRSGNPADPTAGGALHWAPLHDEGVQRRMARIGDWIAGAQPSVMIVDLSVEVITLARLMGVPVVTAVLPGDRSDAAHRLGYELADAIVAPWPETFSSAAPALLQYHDKLHYVGAISRFARRPPTSQSLASPAVKKVLVLQGTGGGNRADILRCLASTVAHKPGWTVQTLGAASWSDDPWPEICSAHVVVTHAGMGALADVAAARKPAVVIPEQRPHDEQTATAAALESAGIAVVATEPPNTSEWLELLDAAAMMGGASWSRWLAGGGGPGVAEVVRDVARRTRSH